MPRPISKVAPDWWDYTTLDAEILDDAARLTAEGHGEALAARLPGRDVRHARGLLPGRGAGVHRGLAASDRRQPGGHLRPDRPDRATCRWWPGWSTSWSWTCAAPISGAWTNGSTTTAGPVPITHPLCFAKADLELCFNRIQPEAADAGRAPALPHRRPGGLLEELRPGPLRGDAGRPGRGEALGVQRSAAAQGQVQGRPAAAGGVPQARRRAWPTCTR